MKKSLPFSSKPMRWSALLSQPEISGGLPYEALFFQHPYPLWIVEKKTGRFLEVNEAAITHYGYSREEFLEMTVDQIRPQEDVEKLKKVAGVPRGGSIVHKGIWRHYKKGQVLIDVEITSHTVYTEGRELIIVAAADITERLKAEKELERSEALQCEIREKVAEQKALFQAMVEESEDMKTLISVDGTILYGTPGITTVLGYPKTVFLGINERDIVHPEDVEKLFSEIKKTFADKAYKGRLELRVRHHDGYFLWCEKVITNMLDVSHVHAIVCNFWNISKEKEKERALTLSNERFRKLVQDGADMIGILDGNGNYKYISPTVHSVLGYDPDELMHKNAFDYIAAEQVEQIAGLLSAIGEGERMVLPPFQFRHKNGEWRWIETVLTNLTTDPSIQGFVSNSRDITDALKRRKELENAISIYQTVSKATSDTIWNWNLQTGKVEWNQALKGLFGYERSLETNEFDWKMQCVHPDDRARIEASIQHHLGGDEKKWNETYRFLCRDGSYRYIQDRGFVVRDKAGKPERMIGSMQDITRQKQEEHRLRLLESVITTSTDAILITAAEDIDSPGPRITYVNKAFSDMTGYAAAEVLGRSPRLLQGIRTDREELARLKNALINKVAFEGELLNYRKDGSVFWNQVSIVPVMDDQGNCTHFISIQRDTTEKKRKEEEVLRIKQNTEAMINSIDGFVWSVSPEFKLISANHAFKTYFGLVLGHTPDEGESVLYEQLGPERIQRWRAHYQKAFEGKTATITETESSLDGRSVHHALVTLNPIYNQEGAVIGAACYSKDVTQLRLMQEKHSRELIRKEQQMTKAIIRTQEKERAFISRELHDNVNQILATAKITLDLVSGTDEAQQMWVGKSKSYIDMAINEIRGLSHQLAPVDIMRPGFGNSVHDLLQKFNADGRYDICFDTARFKETPPIQKELAINLYRILQEQLNNIEKYANASRIEIVLIRNPEKILLEVRDNGMGADNTSISGGIGIKNMEYRTSLFQGDLSVDTALGKGFRLKVEVPC